MIVTLVGLILVQYAPLGTQVVVYTPAHATLGMCALPASNDTKLGNVETCQLTPPTGVGLWLRQHLLRRLHGAVTIQI